MGDELIETGVFADFYDDGETGTHIGDVEIDENRMPDEIEINGIYYIAQK